MAGTRKPRARGKTARSSRPGWDDPEVAKLPPAERKAIGDARAAAGARGYTWPPFEKDNTAHQTHGAGSLITPGRFGDRSGISRAALTRAGGILAECMTNPAFPEYLRWPMFRIEVESWARVQAQADMVYEWLEGLPEEERHIPQSPNAQKTPMELWLHIDNSAAKYRTRLGLTPVAYAKLRLALGLAEKAEADAVDSLGAQGAQIIALQAEEDADGT